MRASKTLIPLALFALAFAGALVVLKRPGAPAAANAMTVKEATAKVVVTAATARPVTVARWAPPAGSAEPSASAMPGKADALPTNQAAASAMPAPPVPETIVASDGPPEVLAAADTVPRVPDDVAQAIDTLRDGTPTDRVLAIQSLAATGHAGRSLSRVRQSLRFAASDQDPAVAARAQEAYDSLLKHE